MDEKIILTGISRTKGHARGEALVSQVRMGWGFNHVSNEDGIVLVANSNIRGECVTDKIVIYPTVAGSTIGAMGLNVKVNITEVGPVGIICQEVHHIDIGGAIASGIPAVDSLDRDPLVVIQNGDWVEIVADEVGKPATVTITRKA